MFGLCNQKLRQQLLGIEYLPYDKARDLAMASEAAAKKSKEMQSGSPASPQVTVQGVQTQKATPTQGQQRTYCYHCGGKHKAAECKFKEAICHFCKKRGHLARVCRTKQRQKNATMGKTQKAHCLTEDQDSTDSADDEFGEIYHVHQKHTGAPPYIMKVTLNDAPLEMELDTGAAVSLISKATYQKLWEVTPKLMATTTCLRTYSDQHLTVLGTLKVRVQYDSQQVDHSILVVDGAGPSLFGQDLLAVLKLNWKSLAVHHTTKHPSSLDEVLAKHEAVFSNKLGKAKNIEAKLNVGERATPRFYNVRPVPYALSEKTERDYFFGLGCSNCAGN